jgi:peptidoglycan/xylan/chitin deacetylase (PgdA/CDA1 family)
LRKQVVFSALSALCLWAACPVGAHPRAESQAGIVVPASVASRLPQSPLPQPLPGTTVERPPSVAVPEPALPVAGIAPNKLSANASLLHVEAERDPYWLSAKQIMVRSTPELLAQHETELGRGVHYNKIFEGNIGRKQVALTFDDGPHPAFTPQILRILKQYHAKATFFVVGEQAERNPDLIRAEAAAGDSIGNHTYDHVSLVKIPDDYVGTEIKACGEVLKQILGRAPHLFRPPGGAYNPQVAQVADSLGYTMVLWTNDPGDYASPGEDVILQRTFSKINNGSIILLHDGIQQTIDVLPTILQYLRDHGYQTVTVDEMLRHP